MSDVGLARKTFQGSYKQQSKPIKNFRFTGFAKNRAVSVLKLSEVPNIL